MMTFFGRPVWARTSPALFDYFVSAGKQRRLQCKAERFRSLAVILGSFLISFVASAVTLASSIRQDRPAFFASASPLPRRSR